MTMMMMSMMSNMEPPQLRGSINQMLEETKEENTQEETTQEETTQIMRNSPFYVSFGAWFGK